MKELRKVFAVYSAKRLNIAEKKVSASDADKKMVRRLMDIINDENPYSIPYKIEAFSALGKITGIGGISDVIDALQSDFISWYDEEFLTYLVKGQKKLPVHVKVKKAR